MVEPCGIVTLLTDFGTRDGYVGAMKGRILAHAKELAVVDISHEIPPGDVLAGAYVLSQAASFFPVGTVHCVVVDPGVGSDRAPVVVERDGRLYVGPDNGVLSMAAFPSSRAVRIETFSVGPGECQTFHGRDIFGPAAAYLAAGGELADLGPAVEKLESLEVGKPSLEPEQATGEVIHVDRFGNLITNIPKGILAAARPESVRVEVAGHEVRGVSRAFSDVEEGEALVYAGSTDRVEIAVRSGSARERLGVERGAIVYLRWRVEGPEVR
jgi:hypothetical protein